MLLILERGASESVANDIAARLRLLGLSVHRTEHDGRVRIAAVGEPGYSTLERQWTRPTLEVNGLWGGYQGPGVKTVVPSEAHAKITARLVPDQEPAEVEALVTRHLERHVPPGTTARLALASCT